MGSYGSGIYGAGIYSGTTRAAEVRKFSVTPLLLVELHFSSGIKYLAKQDLRYNTQTYEGRILSVGNIQRSISRNLGLFEVNSTTIEIDDSDQTYSSLPEPIKGVSATIKLVTRAIGISEAKTVFVGRIDDYQIGDFKVTFTIKDSFLDIPEFPDTGLVDEIAFPNSYPQHRGLPIPICYGTHSVTTDDDFRNRGAWPTLYIDNTSGAKRFLIAGHAVKAINEVYTNRPSVGSTLLTISTDYTPVIAGTINGKTMSWIEFTNTQFNNKVADFTNTAIGDVRVNVQGKENIGNGTGNLLTNPIDVFRDFLLNYCGDPAVDNSKMNEVRDVCTGRIYEVKGGYTEKKSTQVVLSELLRSFNIDSFLTSDGKISASIVDLSLFSISGELFHEYRDILNGSFAIDREAQIEGAEDAQIVNSVEYSYNFHYGQGKFFNSKTSENADSVALYGTKKLVLEMPWVATALAASDVVARIIFMFQNTLAHANFKGLLKSTEMELGDVITITHNNGSDGIAWNAKPCEIIGLVFHSDDFSCDIRARDISKLVEDGYLLGSE